MPQVYLRPVLQKHISGIALRPQNIVLAYRGVPVCTANPHHQQRKMSSAAPTSNPSKKEWLARIPDHPDSLQKRLSVRADHLGAIKPSIENRKAVFGGAILSKHPEEGQAPDMIGSFMLIQADTKEEVLDFLKNDIYTKSGVWDIDSVQVWPFKSAFRTPV